MKPNGFSQARDLPFNRYAWLTTHNSFARLGQRSQTGVAIATAFNQQDTVTDQLNVSLSPSLSPSRLAARLHCRYQRRAAPHSPELTSGPGGAPGANAALPTLDNHAAWFDGFSGPARASYPAAFTFLIGRAE